MKLSTTGIAEIDEMLLKLWAEHHVSPRYLIVNRKTFERLNLPIVYRNKYASGFGPAGGASVCVITSSDVSDGEVLYVTAISEGL